MLFKEKLEKMQIVGQLARQLLSQLAKMAQENVKTDELDKYAQHFALQNGCTLPCFGYKSGFSNKVYNKSICTSVNYAICHGIPGDYKLQNGDILGIDIVLQKNKFNADTCITVPIGTTSQENMNLIQTTKEAMFEGIKAVQLNGYIEDIGEAIENFINKTNEENKTRYTLVREYGGHGIGEEIHEAPFVSNVKTGKKKTLIIPGMFFTIEPMVNLGTHETRVLQDGWTVITKDYKNSAHFEHTIAVTENGVEILT